MNSYTVVEQTRRINLQILFIFVQFLVFCFFFSFHGYIDDTIIEWFPRYKNNNKKKQFPSLHYIHPCACIIHKCIYLRIMYIVYLQLALIKIGRINFYIQLSRVTNSLKIVLHICRRYNIYLNIFLGTKTLVFK